VNTKYVPKYKVGDIVTIRSKFRDDEIHFRGIHSYEIFTTSRWSGRLVFNDEMVQLMGKKATITDLRTNEGDIYYRYKIGTDYGRWSWCDEFFEPFDDPNEVK